jgi:hypothetical protein
MTNPKKALLTFALLAAITAAAYWFAVWALIRKTPLVIAPLVESPLNPKPKAIEIPPYTNKIARRNGVRGFQNIQMWRALSMADSTAPSYVVVKVVDDASGQEQEVCIYAGILISALSKEHNISEKEATKMAKHQLTLPYHFKNLSEHKELFPCYDRAFLDCLRECLASFTDEQLFSHYSPGKLEDLNVACMNCNHPKPPCRVASAYAHVLIERGMLCGEGCISPALWVMR